MNATLTISLHAATTTATLRKDTDGRWRWFDTTRDEPQDMEISGGTAEEALDALVAAHGASSIDGDLSAHAGAARALDAA